MSKLPPHILQKLFTPASNDNGDAGAIPNRGWFNRVLAKVGKSTLINLVHDFSQAVADLKIENNRLRLENERLEKLTVTDGLTGLTNRRGFDELMARLFKPQITVEGPERRGNTPLSRRQSLNDTTLIMFDLDGFKGVNDTYGHDAGDEVLKSVAQKIFAPSIRDTDFLARLGGEEFVIVLFNAGDEGAHKVLNRIEENRQKTWIDVKPATQMRVGISYGVHKVAEGDTALSVYQSADEKLYAMKQEKGEARKIHDLRDTPKPVSPHQPPAPNFG